MTSKSEQIKGTPLKDKPAKIARCGMSHTKFAQHRSSKQWFKLSIQGKNPGPSVEFDFYRQDNPNGANRRTRTETRQLTKV